MSGMLRRVTPRRRLLRCSDAIPVRELGPSLEDALARLPGQGETIELLRRTRPAALVVVAFDEKGALGFGAADGGSVLLRLSPRSAGRPVRARLLEALEAVGSLPEGEHEALARIPPFA